MILSNGMQTTDFDAMEQLFSKEINPYLDRAEIAVSASEGETGALPRGGGNVTREWHVG